MGKNKGTKDRPRLSIFRSNKAIYTQIINDEEQKTLVAASEKDLAETSKEKPKLSKTKRAVLIGEVLAQKASKKGIKRVSFDRRRYRYHGRVKALAEAARKKGLEF